MPELTTRQRDILQILLESEIPLGAADLAKKTNLTARQVSYSLDGMNHWLSRRQVHLKVTPGVGVVLNCSPKQQKAILSALAAEPKMQLVLKSGERRQLLSLILLTADEPLILQHLKQLLQVSRSTVIKDTDALADWLSQFDLALQRKPNFGVWVAGKEQDRRQAVAALLWGETPFGESLFTITHSVGLEFLLAEELSLLPIVAQVDQVIRTLEIRRIFSLVAYAEAQLGGRFTDDSVLYLSLSLAIQSARLHKHGPFVEIDESVEWLRSTQIWPVAQHLAEKLGWRSTKNWPDSEIVWISQQLLAAPRNERWPGDLEFDSSFNHLLDALLNQIAFAYSQPGLGEDPTLRDGIVNHIIPACLRQRFQLWMPSPPAATTLSDKYAFEHSLAHDLGLLIQQYAGVNLPESEINNLALLLRAAYIREQPNRIREVYVVCPSGMATAQLLVARLKAHFPRIGDLEVVSLRELLEGKSDSAELIITTVPLPANILDQHSVIQVHPLLLPEDIDTITKFLS